MTGEEHDVPQLALDAVVLAVADEEAAQPLFGDISFDRNGVAPFSRNGEGTGIHVGAEKLDLGTELVARRFLEQKDRDRIRFFAGRAARNPDADRVRIFAADQMRDGVLRQRLE